MQLTGIWGRSAVNPMRQFMRTTRGMKYHKKFGWASLREAAGSEKLCFH